MGALLSRLLKKNAVQSTADLILLAGLGNPGPEHERQRHNIGFMALDAIAGHVQWRKKYKGEIAEGKIGGRKVIFLKPQTFMNLSGESVGPAAKFYKIPPDRIFVFHDELDIAPGEVRIKLGGGNAGHNGLKSIQAHLGTADFWRIRIGIGRPAHKGDVSDYVLGNFSKEEIPARDEILERLTKNIRILLDNPKNYEIAVNRKD